MIRDRTAERAEGNKTRPTEPPSFTVAGTWHFKKHDLDECIQRQRFAASAVMARLEKAK